MANKAFNVREVKRQKNINAIKKLFTRGDTSNYTLYYDFKL